MSAKSGREVAIRATSGLVYVALVLGLIWAKAPFFQFGMAFFSVLLARESYFLVGKWTGSLPRFWVSSMLLILPLSSILPPGLLPFDPAFGISAFLLLLVCVLWLSKTSKSTILWLNLGILIQLAFWLLSRLGWQEPFPAKVIMVLFFLTWINDTLAYLAGSFFGKTKIAPSISPSKSVEGFFAGLLGSAIFLFFLSKYWLNANPIAWIGFAFLYVPLAVAGDFFESYLKRKAGVKDSGNIMPGHGGAMDRFDSFIFAVPLTYMYIIKLLL
jgi:phosphatidate cytidylyltransferase